MMAALMVEGVRKAFDKAPSGPISGEWLNAGLDSITNFDAEGLIPPTSVTKADHQGGGKCRIARWDGSKFAPATDWFSANQDVVWSEIKKSSAEYKASGK
jgi:branched-chain amino acid transport system substrate-binding protein